MATIILFTEQPNRATDALVDGLHTLSFRAQRAVKCLRTCFHDKDSFEIICERGFLSELRDELHDLLESEGIDFEFDIDWHSGSVEDRRINQNFFMHD